MFEKRFYPSGCGTHRYVSSYKTRRAYRYMGAALVLFTLFLSTAAYSADDVAGYVSSTRRETELRREPYPDAESLGILPAKSLVTLTGEEKGKYVEVEVELEEGSVTGWVELRALSKKDIDKNDEVETEQKIIQARKPRKKKKTVSVPSDEGILLGRTPTFSYGFFAGGHFDFLSIENPGSSARGYGFMGGGGLSFVLDPNFRLRTEVDYAVHSGADELGKLLSFSFIDISATGEIPIGSQFYILAGLQYSLGLGIDNADSLAAAESVAFASDVSGLWGIGGLGYKFPVGEMSHLSLRARYAGAFMISPIGFHTFGLQAVWEIDG